jgi:hypothetical protein
MIKLLYTHIKLEILKKWNQNVDLGTVLGKGTEWRTKDNIKFTYL